MSNLPLLVRPREIPDILGGISLRGFYELQMTDPECPRFGHIGKRASVLFMDELIAYRDVLRRRRDEELARGEPGPASPNPNAGKRPRGRPRKTA